MTQPDATQPTAEALGAALKPEWRAFAEHYARLGDGKAAALAAGYAESGAKNQGHRLLKRPEIVAYLHALGEAERSSRVASITELREFWTTTMRDGGQETKDRLKASEMLGKSFGLFIEKREHSGSGTVQVQITRTIVGGEA